MTTELFYGNMLLYFTRCRHRIMWSGADAPDGACQPDDSLSTVT